MKPCRTLFYLFACSLLSQLAHAQAPDPEVLFRKMCERAHAAKTSRYMTHVSCEVKMDWQAVLKKKFTTKQSRQIKEQIGDKILVGLKMQIIHEGDKLRIELDNASFSTTGNHKKTYPSDDKYIMVYNGEKLYKTSFGENPSMEVTKEEGWSFFPKPEDTEGFTYRLYPAVTINGLHGCPVEVLGHNDGVTRIFVIEPKSYRLLRIEINEAITKNTVSEYSALKITLLNEEINPTLEPNTFLPVAPEKSVPTNDKRAVAKERLPFDVTSLFRTAAKK